MTNLKLLQIIPASFLMTSVVVLSSTTVRADETQALRNQIQVLQQRVDDLQKQLGDQNMQVSVQPNKLNMYDQWSPFEQMNMMDRQINQMMKNNMAIFNPREDIKEMPDFYIVNVDIPGMEKDKINVEVKNGILLVSGDRNSEIKENKPNQQFYLQERSFGHFFRTMPLPEDVMTQGINAKYDNGVLTVKIPRNKSFKSENGVQKISVN